MYREGCPLQGPVRFDADIPEKCRRVCIEQVEPAIDQQPNTQIVESFAKLDLDDRENNKLQPNERLYTRSVVSNDRVSESDDKTRETISRLIRCSSIISGKQD